MDRHLTLLIKDRKRLLAQFAVTKGIERANLVVRIMDLEEDIDRLLKFQKLQDDKPAS